MEPAEAKSEVRALYEASRDLVGGTWTEDTRDWGPCWISDHKRGAQYDLHAFSSGLRLKAEAKEIVDQLRVLWSELGHAAEVAYEADITPSRYILSDPAWLTGTAQNGSLFQFAVSDAFASFTASSQCVVGNQLDLNQAEPPIEHQQVTE